MQFKSKGRPGWVIWFVGLPGSGKSTYAQAVYQVLQQKGDNIRYLSMDERRKAYFSIPQYTEEERAEAYRIFAREAAQFSNRGINVIMDGTAPRLSMREYARKLVQHFAEVFVRCSLETAMNREKNRPDGLVMADLYRKALTRKQTGAQFNGLGEVIGVDTPFEENPIAECVIESERESVEQGRDRVLEFIVGWSEMEV